MTKVIVQKIEHERSIKGELKNDFRVVMKALLFLNDPFCTLLYEHYGFESLYHLYNYHNK